MHPEIRSDKPGLCPKCGMALVEKSDESPKLKIHKPEPGESYFPLAVIIGLIFIVAVLLASSWRELAINFMTGFFIVFAGFKLMDLPGFVEGYATYDILASRIRFYGYVYPFLELAFGLLMLVGFMPSWLLWTEFGVMIFSGFGVVIKLARREEFYCACLGTFLKLPLTYITLLEDFGMGLLALLLILSA